MPVADSEQRFMPILAEQAPRPLLFRVLRPDPNFCLPQASTMPCLGQLGWARDAYLASLPDELMHLLLQLRQTRTFPWQLRALLGRSVVCGVASWTARAP